MVVLMLSMDNFQQRDILTGRLSVLVHRVLLASEPLQSSFHVWCGYTFWAVTFIDGDICWDMSLWEQALHGVYTYIVSTLF